MQPGFYCLPFEERLESGKQIECVCWACPYRWSEACVNASDHLWVGEHIGSDRRSNLKGSCLAGIAASVLVFFDTGHPWYFNSSRSVREAIVNWQQASTRVSLSGTLAPYEAYGIRFERTSHFNRESSVSCPVQGELFFGIRWANRSSTGDADDIVGDSHHAELNKQ